MTTVTYLPPVRPWRQTCSSVPMTRTRSKRCLSAISYARPSVSTAVFAVCHATPSAAATRAIDRWAITMPSNAHRNASRVSFARGAAAAEMSWRHTCAQPSHRGHEEP